MSDDNSVGGGLKDLGQETVTQLASVPISIVKGAASQALSRDDQELEAKKKAEQLATHQSIKHLEAEMAQIRAQNSQKTGPEIVSRNEQDELQTQTPIKKVDELSRQSMGKSEQGRNFKG